MGDLIAHATAARQFSEVSTALHPLLPALDLLNERIDLVALLGELGANTVNYTLLLAAYAAHQRNHPVLYLSNVDADAGRAMLVFPPTNHISPEGAASPLSRAPSPGSVVRAVVGPAPGWQAGLLTQHWQGSHQVPITCGLVLRSRPNVLSGPWPGINTVSSPIGHRRPTMLAISVS